MIRLVPWLHAAPVMAETPFASIVLVFELEDIVPMCLPLKMHRCSNVLPSTSLDSTMVRWDLIGALLKLKCL